MTRWRNRVSIRTISKEGCHEGFLSVISIVWLAPSDAAEAKLANPFRLSSLSSSRPPPTSRRCSAERRRRILGQASDKYCQLAEQAASNSEYERQAPREAAVCYRLYAAYLIILPSGQPKSVKVKDGLPWVKRALESRRQW